MKTFKHLFALALATSLLAGCTDVPGANSGDSSSSGSSSKPVIPSKSGWTEEEEITMVEGVNRTLPFAKDMALEEVKDEDEVFCAKGNYADASDVALYAADLEEAGFVEYDIVPEELAEIANFDDSVDPIVYAHYDNKSGYIPYYGTIIAVGLEAETERFMAVFTVFYYLDDSNFTDTNNAYSGAAWSFEQGYFGYLTQWYVSMFTVDEEGKTEEEIDAEQEANAAKVCLPDLNLGQEGMVGIDDYQFLYPFSTGNSYSEEFHPALDFYFAGLTSEDADNFADKLDQFEYEHKDTSGTKLEAFELYEREEAEGTYRVMYLYDDEFWTMQGGSKEPGMELFVTFFPAEEEAAA